MLRFESVAVFHGAAGKGSYSFDSLDTGTGCKELELKLLAIICLSSPLITTAAHPTHPDKRPVQMKSGCSRVNCKAKGSEEQNVSVCRPRTRAMARSVLHERAT